MFLFLASPEDISYYLLYRFGISLFSAFEIAVTLIAHLINICILNNIEEIIKCDFYIPGLFRHCVTLKKKI